jgi:lipopolysaccharide biosynthesis regulator YciM
VKNIKIDDKWSVDYDPKENDRPTQWRRYGEKSHRFTSDSAVFALFYALLERAEAADAAANRIEELLNTHWQVEAMQQNALLHDALTRAEDAEAKLARAVDALREMHKKSRWLRGEQAYREFAGYIEKTARSVLEEVR